MAKRYPTTRGPSVSTKLPIYTLSGGVSRQAQSKRLPSEAQNMDNALVSLERSFEKRPGFEIVTQNGFTGNISDWNNISTGQRFDLFPLEHSYDTTKDYWFYWFNINDNNRFLVVIDYKATGANDVLIYVFRIRPDGTWSNETQYSDTGGLYQNSSVVSADTRAYITHGSDVNKAKDVLKATTVGSSIVIVNTLVKAGFTSGEIGWNGAGTGGKLFNLDGTESATSDTKGSLITYYSSARYTKGADSKWYLNTKGGVSKTVTKTSGGNFAVGDTITLASAVGDSSYPDTISEATPPASGKVNPSSQNKYYAVSSSSNWFVFSGWSTGGTSFTIEEINGTCTSGNSFTIYTGYFPEVEDFIWHDTTQPWLGQSLADFS